jgi:sugar/nucleoside kinase (ribokinase family)
MYALTEGCDLETCLRAGTLLSTAVIQVTGTALSDEKWSEIRKETDALCK